MDTNVFDKLAKAVAEPDFEGPYRSIVGGLLYVSICTRVDIGFSPSILTQHPAKPKPTHFVMAKRVLFYLKGTRTFGLILGGEALAKLIAIADASFANDKQDRKRMEGMWFFWRTVPFLGL